MNWPLVDKNDDGIRPAGKPDECFYCHQTVGQPHGPRCVMVQKRIRIRHTYELVVDVPHDWDKDMIEFHYNESTWCSDNALGALMEYAEKHGCTCAIHSAEFVKVVDDTPRRDLKEPKLHTGETAH